MNTNPVTSSPKPLAKKDNSALNIIWTIVWVIVGIVALLTNPLLFAKVFVLVAIIMIVKTIKEKKGK